MDQHLKGRSLVGRVALLLTVSILAVGLGVVPASADAPTTFSVSVTFDEVNPCSGADVSITLNFDISEHQGHSKNFVAHVSRSGSTSDGYTMVNGVESFVFNGNVARGSFTDMWQHPDGSKFRVSGVFVDNIRQQDFKVDKFALTCL